MAEQKPSVGRIVHYGVQTYPNLPGGGRGEIEAWAAIVTWVNHDGSVNLRVFHPYTDKDLLRLAVAFSETLATEHWSWPPRVETLKPGETPNTRFC